MIYCFGVPLHVFLGYTSKWPKFFQISFTRYKRSFTWQGRGHPSLNVPFVPFKIASCVFANKAVNRSTFYIRPRYVRASWPENGVYLPEELFYRYIVSIRVYVLYSRASKAGGRRTRLPVDISAGTSPRSVDVWICFLDTYNNLTFFILKFTPN